MFNNHVDVHGRSPLSREKKKKKGKKLCITATEGILLNLLAELSITFMVDDSQERA